LAFGGLPRLTSGTLADLRGCRKLAPPFSGFRLEVGTANAVRVHALPGFKSPSLRSSRPSTPNTWGGGRAACSGPQLQFQLQLPSSLTPQRLAHPLAGVLHLERGHVGVPLGRRHPGLAKPLLHDANVYPLLDQQSRRRSPDL